MAMSIEPVKIQSKGYNSMSEMLRLAAQTKGEETSLGSETDLEIKEEKYTDFKAKIEILVQLGQDELRSCFLSDCYASDRAGLSLDILPKIIFEAADDETSLEEVEVQKPIFRLTVDQGTQAGIQFKNNTAQTLRRRIVNSWSQYEPRLFAEEEIQNHLNQSSFQTFRDLTEKSTLDCLVQNSIADSFCWELTSLYDEETSLQDEEEGLEISGSFSCTESKESERMVSCIDWNPFYKDIFVVSTISCSTLQKRTENLLRLRNDSVLYFMWSARNQFFPKLVLEYFDDLSVINFNPIKPNLLVGGSLSGQLVLWDVKQEMYDRDHTNISKAEFTSPPIVRCCAISIVDHVHKYGVTDVQWVPQNIEITSKGEIIHNTASGYQLITCGISGTLKFWDLRMGVLTKPGHPPPKKFNHLNGIWEPFHSIEVLALDGRNRKSLKCFVMRNGSKSVGQGKDDNGSYNSEFYGGCDDGDILCGSFKLTRDESGKLITKQPEYFNSPLGGAVTVLACSPFMKDVFLTTGGKTIAIWKHDIKSVPVYLRERRAYITSGQWSPTRPALFLLGFQDGSIEVWDLLQNHYYPFVKLFMATSPIKFLSIQSMTENQHLVTAGDSKGIVYTMDLSPSLWIPTENELEKVNQMIEKKAHRILKQSPESIGEPAVPEKIRVPEQKPPTQLEEVQLGEEEIMTRSHGEFSTLEKEALTFLDMAEEEIIISEEEEKE